MEKNVLTKSQKSILGAITQSTYITSHFFLTGGTALSAFYFKHRLSEDFDLFSEKKYDSKKLLVWTGETAKTLFVKNTEHQTLNNQDIYYFKFSEKEVVKVDFAYFPFPHMGTFKKHGPLKISSLEDIATNKIQAIITRGRARDYLDLYLCTKKLHWSHKEMQASYRHKFDISVDSEQLATSFINVLDAEDAPIFLGSNNWESVKKYFLDCADKLKPKIIK